MPDLSVARLEFCAIHYTGNKHLEEGMVLSRDLTPLHHEGLKNVLQKYCLSAFKEDEIYRFTHHTSLDMNEVYSGVSKLFQDPDSLLLRSVELARHLYESTVHPNLPGGELLVAYFEDCFIDGRTTPAIGIYKSENKEKFLRFEEENGSMVAMYQAGISIQKPDKACLIFDQEGTDGYKVLVIENKAGDTQYWREKFLGVTPAEDEYHYTSNMLRMTKDFVTRELPSVAPVEKTQSIDMLNKSLEYFKTNSEFTKDDFARSVFGEPEIIESFMKYDEDYCKYNEVPQTDSFEINAGAVKKQARVFKSVLKLDKNFHVYIHGNRNLIEKGTEPDGRKFYKLYFDEEE